MTSFRVIRHPSRIILGVIVPFLLTTALLPSRRFQNTITEMEMVNVQYGRPGWMKIQTEGSRLQSNGQAFFLDSSRNIKFTDGRTNFANFQEALEARSDPHKVIIMALIDMGALAMGLNFWETSLVPNNIQTYLFISSSTEACQHLYRKMIPCFVYMEDEAGGSKSLYKSAEFLRKMNIRSYMILNALKLGYTVLHTDVDVVWFKNPFHYIPCNQCDVAALWDCGAWNAGFIFVRPTPGGMSIYQKMVTIAEKTTIDDQKALNIAVQAAKRNSSFDLVKLPPRLFQCGFDYFEKGKRDFAGEVPCEQCVVVHNNWIVSMEAKIYRSRELHHWMYDDDAYYSDLSRKYIVFNNSAIGKNISETKNLEKSSLRSALAIGHILNRTVILPVFHLTQKRKGSLLHHLKIRELDSQFFGKYREHTFLSNRKVPLAVQNNRTKAFRINSKISHQGSHADFHFNPRDHKGASDSEIKQWFGGMTESILVFQSLYQAFSTFVDLQMQEEFEQKIAKGLRPAKYRQF